MAEVLTTLAIVVILFALVAMNVVAWQANLRQKEMDTKAQTIYVTAQEQMTKIMAAGQQSLMQPSSTSTDPDGTTKVGRYAKGSESTTTLNTTPGDASATNNIEAGTIAYLKSSDKDAEGTAAYWLFNSDALSCELDEELYNGNWVIEYDYNSLSVYSVFYSETEDCSSEYHAVESRSNNYFGKYRIYTERLSISHGCVGYHNGLVSAGSSSQTIQPNVEVTNGEELTANITCEAPTASDNLALDVIITDEEGNQYRRIYTFGSTGSLGSDKDPYVYSGASNDASGIVLTRTGTHYELNLTLDSLKSDNLRFTKLYGNQSAPVAGNNKLKEGSNLFIHVEAIALNNSQIKVINADSPVFNSLYGDIAGASINEGANPRMPSAYGSGAQISCGRHLQNLDASSNVAGNITSATVLNDIDFGSTGAVDNGWQDAYKGTAQTGSTASVSAYFNGCDANGLPLFKPIENANLTSVVGTSDGNGNRSSIKCLNVDTANSTNKSDNAGLFGETKASSLSISDLNLTGAKVNSSTTGNAGVLVGKASNTVAIENCQVYLLKNTDYKEGPEVYKTAWVTGGDAGGLVGESAGNLTVTMSSASTVVGDAALVTGASTTSSVNAGGLIGKATSGTLTVKKSYADGYVYGNNAAGLIGDATALQTNPPTLTECYAAGYLAAVSNQAGLMNGSASIGSARCYATTTTLPKLEFEPKQIENTVDNDDVLDFKTTDSATNEEELRSYLNDGGSSNTFVQGQASNSSPYNLMGQTLEYYPWPVIDGLKHYGDWVAGFEAGSLVYYEKYQHGSGSKYSYGFYGANVESTLNSKASEDDGNVYVVGDGYGIVYKANSIPKNSTVTVEVINYGDGTGLDQVGNEAVSLTNGYSVTGAEGEKYVVFPLSKDLVNTTVVNTSKYNLRAEVYTTQGGSSTASAYFAFNPHFAKASVRMANATDYPKITKGQQVEIRTARQLWNLSAYYNQYAQITSSNVAAKDIQITFAQGRNIDYEEYEWNNFADTSKVSINNGVVTQGPIGDPSGDGEAFWDVYEGNHYEITNVCFKGTGDYAGLFGSVNSAGKVQNVVLTARYKKTGSNKYYVNYDIKNLAKSEKSLGVLAGKNQGSIANCAVSGYYIAGGDGTLHAYENGNISIGGLVGVNEGKISSCSADTPKLSLSATYATVHAGGFVGRNVSGNIKDSYAVGSIAVLDSKESKVNIAGFAGENKSTVSNSYCAVALTSSGSASTHGFAPKGGVAKGSYYLNGGTYSYIGTMYPYLFDASSTSGKAITLSNLKKQASGASAGKNHSFNHLNTSASAYPFRAVVKDEDGNFVHYGDWLEEASLGTLGVFYWEHEVNGSNNGYKMTFLGTQLDETGTSKAAKASTLCTAHDDGGVISEYGYGYYVAKGEEGNVTPSFTNLATSYAKNNNVTNTAASLALAEQMNQSAASDGGDPHQYTFYAYTTRAADASNGKDYICLQDGTGNDPTVQNGTMKLSYKPSSGDTKQYEFAISPFFANSLQVKSMAGKTPNSSDFTVEMRDGAQTDFTQEPGASQTASDGNGTQTAGNAYEVRSVDQLQYINWNGKAKSADELVSSNNYTRFNYLPYATRVSQGSVSSIGDIVSQTVQTTRANRYWTQTHDVEPVNSSANFTPIAGTSESSTYGSYNAVMYAWFGSTYNGQSYAVKNLNITSDSFNVGLFGTTVGADLSNIIMYDSTGEHVIKRETSSSVKEGAYSIGGLVGVAYDYTSTLSALKTIKNCAISGYTIDDSSSNKLGLGEINVGGLIGVSNTNLTKCSAVTNIKLNQNLFDKKDAKYGIYVRVGGLTGATQATVSDCYSGGSCTISTDMETKSVSYASGYSRYWIYIGGIAGSGFTSNYMNFTNSSSIKDGNPTVKNSYTYFEFPVSSFDNSASGGAKQLHTFAIASVSDRSEQNVTATIDNCYYYGKNTEGKSGFAPVYPTGGSKTNGTPVSLSYEQMAGQGQVKNGNTTYDNFVKALNKSASSGAWDDLTVKDSNGVAIDGRFSFPSSLPLDGKNFPFPTVIRQNDLTFGTFTDPVEVNVHYGDWPINGSHWAAGRDSVDIFADMSDGDDWTYKTCELVVDDADDKSALNAAIKAGNAASLFKFEDGDGGNYANESSLVSIESVEAVTGKTNTYAVKLKIKQDGSVNVRFNEHELATFTLQITADLQVSAELSSGADTNIFDPDTNTLKIEKGTENAKTLKLLAKSKESGSPAAAKDLSVPVTWSEPSVDSVGLLSLALSSNTSSAVTQLKVTRNDSGAVLLGTVASYDYHSSDGGKNYTADLNISVIAADVMGLSNGTTYNQALVSGDKKEGVDTEYASSTKPNYSLDGEDANMFLYTSGTSDYLSKLTSGEEDYTISKIEIDGDAYENGVYDEDKPYYVSFNDEVTNDVSGEFNYLDGLVSYNGESNKPAEGTTVTVKVTFEDGHVLTTKLAAENIPPTSLVTLSFDANGSSLVSANTKTVAKIVVANSKYALPDSTAFEPADGVSIDKLANYFEYWQLGDDVAATYKAGKKYKVGKTNVTFKAVWKHTLKLVSTGKQYASASCVVGGEGVNAFDGYSSIKDDTSVDNWSFDGWYDSNNEKTATKVLDADGNVVSKALTGSGYAASNGILTLSQDVTLYAKWHRWQKTTTFEDGKRYVLVENAGAGTWKIASMLNTVLSSNNGNGAALYNTSNETATVKVIDNVATVVSAVADNCIWQASEKTVSGVNASGYSFDGTYYTLQDQKYGYYLTDSGDNNKTGGIEDIDKGSGYGSPHSNASRSYFCLEGAYGYTGLLRSYNRYIWGSGNGSHLYLGFGSYSCPAYFENFGNALYPYGEVGSFNPNKLTDKTLTLKNGTADVCTTTIPVAGAMALDGYNKPAGSDGWELEGWYTSADSNGKKVLNANGSIIDGSVSFTGGSVSNGTLALSANTTLYAKWKKTITGAYQKITDINDGDYLLGVDAGDGAYTLLQYSTNGSNVSALSNVKGVEDAESNIYVEDLKPAADVDAVWSLSGTSSDYGLFLQAKDHQEDRWLTINGSGVVMLTGSNNDSWGLKSGKYLLNLQGYNYGLFSKTAKYLYIYFNNGWKGTTRTNTSTNYSSLDPTPASFVFFKKMGDGESATVYSWEQH